ncbi:hypothetical protein BDR03DRAFT_1019167 [Suillus americanus]|nr:hypothetical protein BDR03DRAFT_1019167 [Suillus americanus]
MLFPLENTYCFNINLDSPGPKKIVFFHIRQQPEVDTNMTDSETDSETDSDATEIKTEDMEGGNNNAEIKTKEEGGSNDAEMKTEDVEVKVPDVKVEDEDLGIGPDYQYVVAKRFQQKF